MDEEPITLIIADDHTLFRRGLSELLQEQGGLSILGEAEHGGEVFPLVVEHNPDVILLDVHMPGGSGLDALRMLKGRHSVKVLMLTISERDEDLKRALEFGADGYLLKNAEPDELVKAIKDVHSGKAVLAPEVTGKVIQAAIASQDKSGVELLSPREQEVMDLLAEGATNAQIAERLIIAESTVKTHVRNIFRKLEASNRAEAVARASQIGLLSSESHRPKG